MLFDISQLAVNRRSKKAIKGTPRSLSSLKPPVYEELPFVEFTDEQLRAERDLTMVFDVETYPNYWCVSFMCVETKRVIYFEDTPESRFDRAKLAYVLNNYRLVSFNGRRYDVPMITLAYFGASCERLYEASVKLVGDGPDGESYGMKEFEKDYGLKPLKFDHIDIFDVTPLKASLKLYAARLHCKRMQELPYSPHMELTKEQARHVLLYNINDLHNTIIVWNDLIPQIKLREQLSDEYGIDLRSRSDAQIAEHVISHECEKINGYWAKRPQIAPGTIYNYQVPDFVCFQTQELRDILWNLARVNFIISEKGRPKCNYLNGLKIKIGRGVYRMGVGGLHSSESCIAHRATDGYLLVDRDVASFYPNIILNLGLFPKHLGPAFLKVYGDLVNRRLEAKGLSKSSDLSIAELNQVIADSIKITINGSFGKLGSKYSNLYSPDLLIQVTLTGQLALLMLIEMLELNGIQVVSANTDGIVIKPHFTQYERLNEIVKLWEQHTHFETEETQYKAIYNRDVNNYIAVKKNFDKETKRWVDSFPEGTKLEKMVKGKGIFSEVDIWKNPANIICTDALQEFLLKGSDIAHTIESCHDLTKFVTVRTVKGGAYHVDTYVGKAIRWYYAKGLDTTINYMLSGNKVPKSEGAKPCMTLPDEFPNDVDLDWYVNEANALLRDVGYFGQGSAREVEEIELFDLEAA